MSDEIRTDAPVVASDVENEVAQTPEIANASEPVTVPEPVEAAAETVGEITEEVPEIVEETVEEIVEEVAEAVDDVPAEVAGPGQDKAAEPEPAAKPVARTLESMLEEMRGLAAAPDRSTKSRHADQLRSDFNHALAEARLALEQQGIPAEEGEAGTEAEPTPATLLGGIEEEFRQVYQQFRRDIEADRDANLAKKQGLLEELKAIVEGTTGGYANLAKVRNIQRTWKETGPIPRENQAINETYKLYIQQFYQIVDDERQFRDLDQRRNLEAKQKFCEQAEALAQSDDPQAAFRELQKLHEQWKEYGSVPQEERESIWERFRKATQVVNRRFQAFTDGRRTEQNENLAKKASLCEKVEQIAELPEIPADKWGHYTKEIEEIQAEWRTVGHTGARDNERIFARFRKACDAFFTRKRAYYSQVKEVQGDNYRQKLDLVEQAEALKDSTDWKKTAETLQELQRRWKEIGPVPQKKSEALWKRFRSACDHFFEQRDAQGGREGGGDYRANLRAKKALIEEINAFQTEDPQLLRDAQSEFSARWERIGFVPMRDKESIQRAYRDAMSAKFPEWGGFGRRDGGARRPSRQAPLTEKDRLVQQYNALQQEVTTYENNIGFFSASKGAEAFIAQTRERIAQAKAELKSLEEKIRQLDPPAEEE